MDRHYITDEDNSVCVWDGKTGKCVGTFKRYAPQGTPHPDATAQAQALATRLNGEAEPDAVVRFD